jgi:peptidoglycan/xylan/chitin deacetylase (PgdA/CDA1 family)
MVPTPWPLSPGAVDVRVVVKRAAEMGLWRSGLPALARRLRRRDVLVLAYHNVVPGDAPVRGDRSLHLGQERLHRQLSRLSRTHQFIPVDRIGEPGDGRPRVAVTFDDAYRGAIRLGVEVLADLRVPATVFVAPGCLGGKRFWWDLLAAGAELEPAVRAHALTSLQGKTSAVRAWAGAGGSGAGLTPDQATATVAELDAALAFDGLTLASHTWSHPNLVTLDDAELVEELERPLAWLKDRYPARTAEWLSYPYGSWSPPVARLARQAGYRGAFRIDGGWIRGAGGDPHALPRMNVPAGLSVEGLELRGSGLVPA